VKILEPLYYAVSWIMVAFHKVFTSIGFDPAGGWAWGLSIVGLVVVIRILLIPLFVKQIHAQRGLQMLQPEIKKIQERYKNDRERQSQELMKLYKETGTNPLASCLPIVAQAPIFIALFRVLNKVGHHEGIGAITTKMAENAANATVLGAPISSRFLGSHSLNVQIVTAAMIVLMSASTFITQKQLMTKNMPAAAMNNPFAQQQKILLYVFPLIFAVSGVNFPIGVLVYWLTTNVWTMGQQLFVIRRMPTPGSIAAENLEKRKKRSSSGTDAPGAGNGSATATATEPERPVGQRQQPKRQQRAKRPAQRSGDAARPREGTEKPATTPDPSTRERGQRGSTPRGSSPRAGDQRGGTPREAKRRDAAKREGGKRDGTNRDGTKRDGSRPGGRRRDAGDEPKAAS
jgi:YidC/Oxa1 family membrane protein insertase